MVRLEQNNYTEHSLHEDLFLLAIKYLLALWSTGASLSKRQHEAILFCFKNIQKCGFFVFVGTLH